MYSDITEGAARAFPDINIPAVGGYYGDIISLCGDIYRGEPPWKTIKRSGLYGRGERDMALMNAAKVLCDQLADMTFGQQVDIIIHDRDKKKYVDEVLQKNGFWDRMVGFFSRAYALGGGAVRVFINKGRVMLDYIAADSFIPVGWSGMGVDEGIFRSVTCSGGRYFTLFELHGKDSSGLTFVRSRRFVSDSAEALGSEDREYGAEEFIYPYDVPMFSYFHPAAANNITDCGVGLSCFYNCIDTLKALDIALDSLTREFILGRKRIIVPSSCIRTVVDPETGSVKRYFDADDEVYQALRCDDENELKIIDNTAELRIEEHTEAINTLLNILCFQTGLSSGTLSFGASSGVRTAAEIASQENRTQRTMISNRNIAAEFIEGIVRAVLAAGAMLGHIRGGEEDVRISFSKELDRDIDREIDRNIRLCEAGLKDRKEAIEEIREFES